MRLWDPRCSRIPRVRSRLARIDVPASADDREAPRLVLRDPVDEQRLEIGTRVVDAVVGSIRYRGGLVGELDPHDDLCRIGRSELVVEIVNGVGVRIRAAVLDGRGLLARLRRWAMTSPVSGTRSAHRRSNRHRPCRRRRARSSLRARTRSVRRRPRPLPANDATAPDLPAPDVAVIRSAPRPPAGGPGRRRPGARWHHEARRPAALRVDATARAARRAPAGRRHRRARVRRARRQPVPRSTSRRT